MFKHLTRIDPINIKVGDCVLLEVFGKIRPEVGNDAALQNSIMYNYVKISDIKRLNSKRMVFVVNYTHSYKNPKMQEEVNVFLKTLANREFSLQNSYIFSDDDLIIYIDNETFDEREKTDIVNQLISESQ